MRNPDGTLNGDLNDNLPAHSSGSISFFSLSNTNENETVYDLLPVFINKPPIIISPISEASDPPIKPYATADATGDAMYLFPDGSVKTNLGATFTFKLIAQQPSILNVENGIPTMIPPNEGLTYVWRKDGNLVTSYDIESLQSRLIVSSSTLQFVNIQPEHAGTYVCEVQNDIGTTSSETINLEVLNLDFDEFFYKNLVRNPYGKQGTDEWESNSDDFTTKKFSEIPSQEFKRPNRVDLFGYTPDMLHPRPYQLDSGVLRGFNMTEDLVINQGSYFTRARLKYLKRGGATLVRAYQDIDLTDIQPLLKGGVFGVEGVRAVFSCYIGNAINRFQLVRNLLPITKRTDLRYYIGKAPRIGVENTLNSGPPQFPSEDIYVSIEEYDNDIRLSTKYYDQFGNVATSADRLIVRDPWNRKWFWYGSVQNGTKIYPTDVYGVGSSSKGDFLDVTLLTAQDLYPDPTKRYTYGQYVEFNKLVLERLNPKTTKVRIVLNFVCNDSRMFDTSKELYESSDEIFEILGWEFPWKKNTWESDVSANYLNNVYQTLKRQDSRYGGVDPLDFLPLANDPRGMITALNLTLLPILTQNNSFTNTITNNILTQNSTQESFVPSVLDAGRDYDPAGLNTRRWRLKFRLNDKGFAIGNSGLIEEGDELELSIEDIVPSQSPRPVSILTEGLFPFSLGSIIYTEGVSDLAAQDASFNTKSEATYKRFAKYRYIPTYNVNDGINTPKPAYEQKYQQAATSLENYLYVTDKSTTDRLTIATLDYQSIWEGKARYHISFALPDTSQSFDPRYYTQLLNIDQPNEPDYVGFTYIPSSTLLAHQYPILGYYLSFDFSDLSNTKVTLSRNKDLFPPDDPNTTDITVLSGSFDLRHSMSNDLVLRCNLDTILTASMNRGGMGYKTMKQTLPSNQFPLTSHDPFIDPIPFVERTTESIVRISDHPIQCIRALRTNIGAYSLVRVENNYFYIKKVNEILQPVQDDIDNFATTTTPFALDELRSYSASLNDYAYNSVPFYFQLNSIQPNTLTEPDVYQQINQYYSSTLNIDLADTTFANEYTFGLSSISNSQPTNLARQTLRSPYLLNLRVRDGIIGPSLVGIKPVDSRDGTSGVGSPSYGTTSANNDYIIAYAPLQDKVAGTYL